MEDTKVTFANLKDAIRKAGISELELIAYAKVQKLAPLARVILKSSTGKKVDDLVEGVDIYTLSNVFVAKSGDIRKEAMSLWREVQTLDTEFELV